MITLETVDVTKSFGGIKAVDNVSISFESGQITALIGPNGAGKTTLFHLITGMIPPDNGQILYKGQEIQGRSPWEIARLGIGRLFQDVRIFPHLTVLENVLTAFKYQPGEGPKNYRFDSKTCSQRRKNYCRYRTQHECCFTSG